MLLFLLVPLHGKILGRGKLISHLEGVGEFLEDIVGKRMAVLVGVNQESNLLEVLANVYFVLTVLDGMHDHRLGSLVEFVN